MEKSVVFEKDLLYATENLSEPGIVHVQILSPNVKNKIPVVIEGKTPHSVLKHIHSVVDVMQKDIFDRIMVDVKANTGLYVKVDEPSQKEFSNREYVEVLFDGEDVDFKAVEDIV